MQNRFIRLTTTRYTIKNSPRFENMLMTTRRTPAIGGYGASANMQVINPVGTAPTRTSFFSKRFSTYGRKSTNRAALNTKLVSERLRALDRFLTSEKMPTSSADSTRNQLALKTRFVTKMRTQQLTDLYTPSLSLVDIRQTRLKSLRNSEYLQRLKEKEIGLANKQAHFHNKTSLIKSNRAVRSTRTATTKSKFISLKGTTKLSNTRSAYVQRRVATLRKAQSERLTQLITKRRQIYSLTGRLRNREKYKTYLLYKRKRKKSRTTAPLSSPITNVYTEPALLHTRQAQNRTSFVYYTAPNILSTRVIQLRKII